MSDENIDNIFETVCLNIKQLSGVDINRPKYHRIFLKLAKTVYNNSDIKRTDFLNDKCIKKTTEFFSDYLRKKGLDNPGVEQFTNSPASGVNTNPPASGVNTILNTSNNMNANPMDGYLYSNQDVVLSREIINSQTQPKSFISNGNTRYAMVITGELNNTNSSTGTIKLSESLILEGPSNWNVTLESVQIAQNSASVWSSTWPAYFVINIDGINPKLYSNINGVDGSFLIPNETYGKSLGEANAAADMINYKLKTNRITKITP